MIREKKTDGDYYTITSGGKVKTCNWRNTGRNAILKPAKDKKGYLRVGIMINGKLKTRKVHRLVAIAFVPNPLNLPQVNHIDTDKTNNNHWNLEWCTNKQNASHAIKNGLFSFVAGWNKGDKLNPKYSGENIGTSKLTEKEVFEIREKFIPRKITRKMLAVEYGVSEHAIKDIIIGKSWKFLK